MFNTRHQFVSWFFAALWCGVAGARGEDKTTFNDHVAPVLANACSGCHNADKKKGGLDLGSVAAILAGGGGGAVVEAGNPDGSRLVKILRQQEEPRMPPDGPPLDEASVALIAKWIAGGMLQSKDSKAAVSRGPAQPVFSAGAGKPDGPPAMPEWLPVVPYRMVARNGPVLALAASPWAPLVAVGGERQIAYYHADTLDMLGVLDFPEGGPFVLRFSGDGKWLLAAGGNRGKSGRVVIWEVQGGRRRVAFGEESDVVLAADMRPDFSQFSLGGSSRKVKFHRQGVAGAFQEIKQHTDWVTAVSYSPDGILLATGDRQGGVMVWESDTRAEFHTLRGHEKAITVTAWRPDGNVLATGSEDGGIRMWDMNSGKNTKTLAAHAGGVLDAAWSHDGQLASVGRDGKIKVWQSDGALAKEWADEPGMATRVAFLHDGKRLATGGFSGEVKFWNLEGGRLARFPANPEPPSVHRAAASKARAEALAALPAATEAYVRAQAEAARNNQEITVLKNQIAGQEEEQARIEARKTQLEDAMAKAAAGLAGLEGKHVEVVAAVKASGDALAAAIRDLAAKEAEVAASAARLAESEQRQMDAGVERARAIAGRDADPQNPEWATRVQEAEKRFSEAESTRASVEQSHAEALKRRDEDAKKRGNLESVLAAARMELQTAEQRVTAARDLLDGAKKEAAAAGVAHVAAVAARDHQLARLRELEKSLAGSKDAEGRAKQTMDEIVRARDNAEYRIRKGNAGALADAVRAARSEFWLAEDAHSLAREAVANAESVLARVVARRDASRSDLSRAGAGEFSEAGGHMKIPPAWKLAIDQAGVNFARRRLADATSAVDRRENFLVHKRAVMEERVRAYQTAVGP